MKLSRLVAYRESLDALPFEQAAQRLTDDIDICKDTFQQCPIDLGPNMQTIQDISDAVARDIRGLHQSVKDIKTHIDAEISRRSKDYFAQSYRAYDSIRDEPIDQLMNRELRMDEEGEKFLRHRVKINSNWKYPGLLIRTQKMDLFQDMLDSDPLYLYDTSYQLLEPCLSKLTPEYRARVRTGMIDEKQDQLFPRLPVAQMGLVFAWNYLNYRPIEIMRRYFEAVFLCLRPGGTFIFTYNNCSRSLAVILCEHAFASYTPVWAVRSMLENIGFVIDNQYNGAYHLSFLEVHKPGELASLRGGQSLAMINPKLFTRAQMAELVSQASQLDIQIPCGEIDYAVLESQVTAEQQRRNQLEQERLERQRLAEQQRQEELRQIAEQQAASEAQAREQRRQWLEQQRLAAEAEEKRRVYEEIQQRIAREKDIRDRAQNLNIPDRDTMPFEELEKAVEHIEHMNELNHLRKEAVRLKLDRTDLIMRKYTLKELKRAIKQWRAENERPPT